jgi:Xaa-Pro aminopeptidase
LEHNLEVHLQILRELPNWTKPGMTENELKRKLEMKFYEIGAVPSFSTIVANLENGTDIHHVGSDKKISEGPLIIDSGIKMNGMCTDITWTYWVGSNPSEKFLKAYQDLQEIKKKCLNVVKPGIRVDIPAILCRELMTELGYDHEKLYSHSLGHALGFETHDVGHGMSRYSDPSYEFMEGNVYTLEPGLYWKGEWGIRLEDNFVLTKNGTRLLSKCPEDPILIN